MPDTAKTNGDANVHALTVKSLDGKDVPLANYKGKAVLIVNTASECGYTPQYASLQKLYATYKDKGLEVLAFPSNDFGAQEPGDSDQIRTFVDEKYNVEFAMFEKVHATGPEKAPLYEALTEKTGEGVAGDVRWNFTKFLVDPDGKVVARFESKVDPMSEALVSKVQQVLPKS